MAAHVSARTTKLYDRRNDQVTLDQVERIVLQSCDDNPCGNASRVSRRPRARRRIPFAGERFGLRAIKAHGEVEWPFRRGKPVRFFVFAGAFVLEVQIERAIYV